MSPLGYVGPRNLPSTGFFPFLQTLMCNTDSNCHNKSQQVDPAASKLFQRNQGNARYPHPSLQIAEYTVNSVII